MWLYCTVIISAACKDVQLRRWLEEIVWHPVCYVRCDLPRDSAGDFSQQVRDNSPFFVVKLLDNCKRSVDEFELSHQQLDSSYSITYRIIHTTLVLSMEVFEPFAGYYFFNILLMVLQGLHIFWAKLILHMFYKFLKGKVRKSSEAIVRHEMSLTCFQLFCSSNSYVIPLDANKQRVQLKGWQGASRKLNQSALCPHSQPCGHKKINQCHPLICFWTFFVVCSVKPSVFFLSWKKMNAVMKKVRLKRKRRKKGERRTRTQELTVTGRKVKTLLTPNCLCSPTAVSLTTWPTTGRLWWTECVKLSRNVLRLLFSFTNVNWVCSVRAVSVSQMMLLSFTFNCEKLKQKTFSLKPVS